MCYSVSVKEGTVVTEDESSVKIPSTRFFFSKVTEMRTSEWKCFSLRVTNCERSSMISRERQVQGQSAAPLLPACLPAKQKRKVGKCEIKEPKYEGKKEELKLK